MAFLWVLVALTALFGLIVGSFLNVVIHRLPRGRSVVWPASACPWCEGRIAARDNVPILGYLLLGRRCRRCGAPISPRYAIVEALTAILFVGNLLRFGATVEAAAGCLFCALIVALAGIDLEHLLLPDHLTLSGVVAGIALQPWLPRTTWLEGLVGALAGAGLLILTMNFWYWLRHEEGMGLGDVNMMAMVGAFLGWKGIAVTLLLGTISGALVGVALILGRRLSLRSKLPFGVFLAFGALVALFWGPEIVDGYLKLL